MWSVYLLILLKMGLEHNRAVCYEFPQLSNSVAYQLTMHVFYAKSVPMK